MYNYALLRGIMHKPSGQRTMLFQGIEGLYRSPLLEYAKKSRLSGAGELNKVRHGGLL